MKTFLPALPLLIAGLLLSGCPAKKETGSPDKTQAVTDSLPQATNFIPNTVCSECHPAQFREWTGSHHQLAMQEATDQTVLGNFNNTSFMHRGVTSRFFKKGKQFFVSTDGPDGKMADFEISYVFGVDPLQQVLIETEKGRLQAFTIAWDTGKKRWFHLYPDEKISYDDPLHWTGRLQNWNSRCAECHTTNLKKGYTLETDSYQTTWSEINVSCQACHGPGEKHVGWARENNTTGGQSYGDMGLLADFDASDSLKEIESCARCHARRHAVSPTYQHGRPLLDDFVPALLTEALYYPDGQILDEVYVYGSFIQSRMFHQGVRCTDCHNPHTAGLKAEGNQLCVKCHQPEGNSRFKTLKSGEYDSEKHHFHAPGSPGAQCVNCHMPEKTYMVVDPRRDHSLRIPRPDLSVRFGTPNACTMCHQDQPAQWALDSVKKWYGTKKRKAHFAGVIAAGRAGERDAGPGLIKVAGDSEQPAIVRATALDLLERYGAVGAGTLVEALNNEDPLIRTTAVSGLGLMAPQSKIKILVPLLEDPVRAVRMEAARVLSSVPPDLFDLAEGRAFEAALGEFKATQEAGADQPGSHLNLGAMYAGTGKGQKAEASYKTAIRLDPHFLPARFNLANLYNAMGRNDEAEGELRELIKRWPENGEAYYSLGLLLAEMDRLEDSAAALKTAAVLLPGRARIHYNFGLTLQHLNRRKEAEEELLRAHEIDRGDPGIVNALAIFYIQDRSFKKALPYAQKLVALAPGAPGPQQVLKQVQGELGSEGASK